MPEVFDALADSYDDAFTNSLVGQSQRSEVWYRLGKVLGNSPLRILELNCGTGEDAIRFAQLGHAVTATDISPEMIRVAKSKNAPVDFHVLDARNIEDEKQPFDLVFSNFGGLNFLSEAELKDFTQNLDNRLVPGGKFVLVLIHSYCFWEMMYFSLRFRFGKAFRRQRRKSDYKGSPVYYYSQKDVRKIFSGFQLLSSCPVGVITPPSYDEKFLRFFWRKPRIQHSERKAERLAAKLIGADHWMYVFQKI
jgi:SAM-dependent methyltransferase